MLIILISSAYGVSAREVYTREEFTAYCRDRAATLYWALLVDKNGEVLARIMGDLK